jgi:hypothetical protein
LALQKPPAELSDTGTERRSFGDDKIQLIAEVTGSFEPNFWDILALHLCHRDTTIRQCVSALSIMYEAHKYGEGQSMVPQTKSLCAYNEALRDVRNHISLADQQPEVTLICCIIFAWIELLLNNMEAGLRHLESGLKILQAHRTERPMDTVLLYDTEDVHRALDRSFTRLSVQLSLHGCPMPKWTAASVMTPIFTTGPIPSSFANIFEARIWLDNELNSIFVCIRKTRTENRLITQDKSPCDPEVYDSSALIEIVISKPDRLKQWEMATGSMIRQLRLSKPQLMASRILYLHLYHTWIGVIVDVVSRTSTVAGETSDAIYVEHNIAFERMLQVAQAIIKEHDVTVTPLLSFDMRIIPPLYFVALKCRVPRLRRLAIELLKRTPEEESLWRRQTAVQCAERKLGNE